MKQKQTEPNSIDGRAAPFRAERKWSRGSKQSMRGLGSHEGSQEGGTRTGSLEWALRCCAGGKSVVQRREQHKPLLTGGQSEG